ncbi:AfsR/SARP family transcriptional regulator [Catenuloplanes japonicus]|uniref:AfsR/SARP family transcriptional regulator n=1 Tax=Catenuloplanes japonicus TaxID=33876 RepID=UPI000A0F71F5|nr:BTAD domain-containing putative transcriptional regulator [Catenuloplanes japonicus]
MQNSTGLAERGASRLRIMGPLRLWQGDAEVGAGPRQQRVLLALLVAQVGRPISMANLVELLWGTAPPATAVNVIHKYVGVLRRLLEPGLPARATGSYLIRHNTGYRFAAGPDELDLLEFRQLAGQAKESLGRDEPGEALDLYLRALRLCDGPAGETLGDSVGATAVFAGVDGEFFDAAVDAAELAVRLGRAAQVLAPLRLAAQISRLHEPVHASLVTALAAAGHQAEALEVYAGIRARLADELGIDPGHELRDAQHRVLTQDAGPAPETARQVTPARPAQLPPDPSMFVGRRHELAVLHDLVHEMRNGRRTGPMVAAVDGMGGVGKSALVVHFAHQVAHEFTDGQLYLDLRGHGDEGGGLPAADALRAMLHALGLRASDVPDTVDALVGAYRSLTAGRKLLLLLDDVRDASQVRPLLPNSADSLVLITSRGPLVALAASDGARLHRAPVPGLAEAREILSTRLGAVRAREATVATLDEIITLCGRLPLALAILAARLGVRPNLSLATVAAELRDGARRLAAFPEGRGVAGPRTAFSWSYRQLSPGAARLFRLLSASLVTGITVEACLSLSGEDPGRTRDELEELTEAALVAEDDQGRYTSHVLVRAYAHELFETVDPAPARRAAITRLLQYYLHSSFHAQVLLEPNRTPIPPATAEPGVLPERPESYQEAFGWFARHRETLKEAVRVAADTGHGVVAWQLALTMQQYFEWSGFFQDWEDVMRHALRGARDDGDPIGEAHVLRSLAGARWFFDANEESLGMLSAALQVYVDHGMLLEQALTHINFHSAYTALGKHDLALFCAETAVSLCRAAGSTKQEMRSLDCKGRSLTRLGQYEEAAEVLQLALDLNLVAGRRHEEAMIRVSVARNLIGLGRTGDAVGELRRAVEAARSVSQGPYHFEAFRSLAELLHSTGDLVGARRAFEGACAVLETFQGGGPHHMRAELARLEARL